MKTIAKLPYLLIPFIMLFPGCQAIGDIFKAGIWVGIIIVIAIIAIVGFIIKMFSK